MIYFDNAATTKPYKEIIDIYNKVNSECWYNASSQYRYGTVAHNLFDKAIKLVERTLNLTNKKVVFTSSATEANNKAIYGICNKYKNQNKRIITTKYEHPSVLNCFKDLENYFDVKYLDILENGEINYSQLESFLNNDTVFVSIMYVNNIIGSINDINRILKLVRRFPRVKLHVDGVQGVGKIKLGFNIDDVDLLTASAHKNHGLKGTALLVYNKNLDLELIEQGSKQQLIKSGTIDLAGAVSCAKTFEIAFGELDQNVNNSYLIKKYIYNELCKNSNVHLNSSLNGGSPHILNFSYPGVNSETLMHYFESNDIYVSISSACSEKLARPEPVVLELTKNELYAKSSIRLSFSSDNTIDDAKKFIEVINKYKKVGKI